MTVTVLIIALVVIVAVIALLYRSVRTVPEASAYIIERFGTYHRTLGAGTKLVIPFIDSVRARLDLRQQVVSFPPQPVTTADNLVISVDTVVYFKVTDPRTATYAVANYLSAIEQHTIAAVRKQVGDMDLEYTLTARDEINTTLRGRLASIAEPWGIEVAQVEVKAIDPPPTVQEAMDKRKEVDRDRQARIAEAEGVKQAQILSAEGEKQAAVLRARGAAEASVLRAKAEAEAEAVRARGQSEAIAILAEAIEAADPDHRLLAYQYLQTLPRLADGAADKVWVVPGDLGGVLGALGGADRPRPPRQAGPVDDPGPTDADLGDATQP